jgi:RNA polymerase sigma-70 factor, ECF subfamily
MYDDEILVKEVVHNKTDAVRRLYEHHSPYLLSLCLRYCGTLEDAEDVLHDGFIKIIRNIHTFRPRDTGSFKGWMKRIMVNTSLNFLRDKTKANKFIPIEPLVEKIASDEEDEHDLFIDPERFSQELVMKMICELPEGYRTVFNMYVFEEFTHREIAQALHLSENTSKSQLSKARALLRKKLNQATVKQTI